MSSKCAFVALSSSDVSGGLLCTTCGETFEKEPICPKQRRAMTTDKPLFRFNTQVVESDPTGYRIIRWDSALPVAVIAPNREEAFKKVKAVMGSPAQHNTWVVKIDSVEEIWYA